MMVWKMMFLFQGCILRYHVNLPGWTWFEKKNIHCWTVLAPLSFRTAPWIFKSPVFTWIFVCDVGLGKIPGSRIRRKDRRGGIGLSIHQSINQSINQSNQIKSNQIKSNPSSRSGLHTWRAFESFQIRGWLVNLLKMWCSALRYWLRSSPFHIEPPSPQRLLPIVKIKLECLPKPGTPWCLVGACFKNVEAT